MLQVAKSAPTNDIERPGINSGQKGLQPGACLRRRKNDTPTQVGVQLCCVFAAAL